MRNNREQEIYEEGFTAGKMESTKYWKPRVQALERAIIQSEYACDVCLVKIENKKNNIGISNKCINCYNNSKFEFDIERFKEVE